MFGPKYKTEPTIPSPLPLTLVETQELNRNMWVQVLSLFEATNLNLLKVDKLDRNGIPCSICKLNWIYVDKLVVNGIEYNFYNKTGNLCQDFRTF